MKTIIMVRHGQSVTNLDKVFTGQLDAPLTDIGRQQARLMAQYLDFYQVNRIFASPLQRAVDTADAIAVRQNCTVEKCSAIMEINSGHWQGLTFDEIAKRYPVTYQAWKTDIGSAEPDSGETCVQLYDRVTAFFKEMLQMDEKTICLVCHATPIRMMESYMLAGSVAGAQEIPWVPNASVTVYEYDGTFRAVERGTCDFLGDIRSNLPKNI